MKENREYTFKINTAKLTIDAFLNNRWFCDVDLEEINSCAEMLDWIFHMHKRHNAEEFYEFCKLLDKIFNPQANCCSWGKEKKFNGTALTTEFIKKNDTGPGTEDPDERFEVTFNWEKNERDPQP